VFRTATCIRLTSRFFFERDRRGTTTDGSMRRPGIAAALLLFVTGRFAPATAAALAPSADPVTDFIVVADSLARTADDAAFSSFLHDNALLVGAAVARLLDTAFQVAQAGDAAGASDNVAFARRVALAHEAAGGTAAARALVEAYAGWTPAQRAQRAKAITLEEQAGVARKGGDIAKAADLLTQARALYGKIGDRHSVAVNWGTMGVAHWGTGDWDLVIADYDQALAARRAVEDRILEGRTLNGLGTAHQQKGEWDRAAEYYNQAIDLRRKTGDLAGLGTSMTYLGHVYNNSGRYVDARNQYEAALPILEQLGNPQQMVEMTTGIAAVNFAMGRIEDANDAYRRGIDLSARNGLGAHEMLCRRNLADNYRRQGRYADALDELALAFQLLPSNPDPDEELLIYQTRGLTFLDMGELDDARNDLLKAAELAETTGNPVRAIDAQTNVGYLYRELGAFDRALKAADNARQLSEQAGDARRYRDALVLRGDTERRLGRFEASLATFQEALAQDQADQATAFAVADEVAIAGVHALTGRTTEARAQLRALTPRARATSVLYLEWACLFAMGESFEQESPDSAAYYYDRALATIAASAGGTGGAEVQTGFLTGETGHYYEEVLRYYASVHERTGQARWSDRSFQVAEQMKARGLLELMRRSVAQTASAEEAAVLDRLYSLDPAAADYADQRAALEKQYVDMRRARVDSRVGSLAGSAGFVDPDALGSVLAKKTVLLEYALGDSASFVWAIDRNGRELFRLPPRREIEGEVRRLRDAIARVGGGEEAMLRSARALHAVLLSPAAPRLARAETLVIVPDGGLFELPFDVLLSADPIAGGDMSAQPYLARTHATVYTPSATIYARLKSAKRDGDYERDLLAVGNPDFTALNGNGGEPLAPLPYAEAEVKAIGTRIKDSRKVVLTGTGASEASVKRELRSEAPRVVHLATHGLVDAAQPARSSVALAADGEEDGYFYTLEILATPTRSDLVVMSACESARGKVSRGEGVVGLSRAFLAAGAESVVASLWAVSDESTGELMRILYDRMFGKKESASRSLREARLALIKGGRFAHPFHWSPFIVTGTERSPW
jgi:CHAT domain-containing protein